MIKKWLFRGLIFSGHSGLFENFSDCSVWLDESRPSKKLLLFWSCKQANYTPKNLRLDSLSLAGLTLQKIAGLEYFVLFWFNFTQILDYLLSFTSVYLSKITPRQHSNYCCLNIEVMLLQRCVRFGQSEIWAPDSSTRVYCSDIEGVKSNLLLSTEIRID